MRILIQNGTVVNGDGSKKADVLIENDRISAVGESLSASGAKVIDAAGCYILPGFIDTHTHFDLDLGFTVTADNFVTGSRAAILGGTTCVLDFATPEREQTMQEGLDLWHQKAQGASCNYGFHMTIARWDESIRKEMRDMTAQGVTSYKMYMVYDGLKVDDGEIYAALQEAKQYGALIGVHCENWDVLRRMIAETKAKGILSPMGHALSRPAPVEAEAVARYMRIAELAHAPAYVVHLSTAEGLAEAKRARARGQEVYLESCPQYFTLTDACYDQPDGLKFIMSPPIRKPMDRAAITQALQDNDIDAIGTDHCSFTMAQKSRGKDDFSMTPNGAAGVQHRGQLLYTLGVCQGRISMEQMVRLLSANAAALFGMREHGAIASGKAADVVIWEPDCETLLTDTNHAYNCDNTIYAGLTLKGRARDVILNGKQVVDNGALIAEGTGRYIPRKGYRALR
ncbi:MAG: dihydropyrimidinase [Clostridia bacterium]|nr:dihydropyrimidinase [Clostridia bacterium]